MLDFCGEHNITSDIELIDMQDNKAYDRVTSNDVKYRFVIDMKSLKIKVFIYIKTASKVILDAVFFIT
jgi:hypothetical protein